MTEEQLNEYRIFHLASQAIVPLIEQMHKNSYEKLMNKFRDGSTDLTNSVARLEALYSLLEEIKTKSQTYEHHISKRST